MRTAISVLRIVLCAIVFLLTLEALTRLDDHLQFGAPFWGSYDFTRLTMRDRYGLIGRPNGRFLRWSMNGWGFRGPLPRSGTIRIVCLGASETFGIGEDNNREFPRQLEEQLNQALGGRLIEVINLAVPGTSMRETVPRLPEIMDRYHPSFVTIYPSPAPYIFFTANHPLAASAPGPPPTLWVRIKRKIQRWVPARALTLSQAVWRRLRYPDLPQARIEGRIEDLGARALPARVLIWWRRREADASVREHQLPVVDRLPDENVEMFRSDLVAIVEFFRTRGVPVVLATHAQRFGDRVSPDEEGMLVKWRLFYPGLKEGGFLDMELRMNEAVRDVAREHGAVLADAARVVPPGPRYFADFVHFSNAGAERMAALLAEKLTPLVKPSLKEDPAR
jgi:lysophospholipase L1-like esterase